MRRILLATLTLCAGLIGMTAAASAGDLGPIVLGMPRTEDILFCFKNNSLDALIDFEEKSVGEIIDRKTRLETVRRYVRENKCWVQEVRYTPQKILRTWVNREYSDSSSAPTVHHALIESTTMIMTEGQVTQITIFVISHDPLAKKTE